MTEILSPRRARCRWRRVLLVGAALLLGVGIVVAIGLFQHFKPYWQANTGFGEEALTVRVPLGTSGAQLAAVLSAQGALADSAAFHRYLRQRGLETRSYSGQYRVVRGSSTRAIVNQIAGRRQLPVQLVVTSTRTTGEWARRVASQLAIDSAALNDCMRDSLFLASLGFTPRALPSMVIPNTYEVYWDIAPEQLLARLVREHDAYWSDTRRALAAQIPLTPLEISTLASIIQEEVVHPSELPMVAGVYINRLRRGMHLQACPTAKYAAGNMALTRVLKAHTQIESPYNTYIHPGLPPGPIIYPSMQALEAVLHYAHHDYLYFCAKADFSGYHHFSRTGLEHMRYAEEYHRALTRQGHREGGI